MKVIESIQYNLGEFSKENDVEQLFGKEITPVGSGVTIKIVGWNENPYELVQEKANLGHILTGGTTNCLLVETKVNEEDEWELATAMYYTYLPAQNHDTGIHRYILDRLHVSDSLYLTWVTKVKGKNELLDATYAHVFLKAFPSIDIEQGYKWLDAFDEDGHSVSPYAKLHIILKSEKERIWDDVIKFSDFGLGVFFSYGLNLPITVDSIVKKDVFYGVGIAFRQFYKILDYLDEQQKQYYLEGYTVFLESLGYSLADFLAWFATEHSDDFSQARIVEIQLA
jgi:hypothetical protein